MSAGPQKTGSFRDGVCLPFLRDSQNQDGGWGYQLRSESRTEATSWAVIALQNIPQSGRSDPWAEALDRGTEWLLSAQLPDGSWPSHRSGNRGCWCTSLALLALKSRAADGKAAAKAREWLLGTWPAEGGIWWRLRNRLRSDPGLVRQNLALRGWGWTPGTSSWVEPTSYALLALEGYPENSSRSLRERRRLGEAMLLDRMCPGGGWNNGNPRVYGVAGEPAVGPTVWALLALRRERSRPEVERSLTWLSDWLSATPDRGQGPASIALASICLETLGRSAAPPEPALKECYDANQFLTNVLTFAWATMALTPECGWPACGGLST